jgi:hypothetical protein
MSIATENLPLPHRHCHEGSISARVRRFQKKMEPKTEPEPIFQSFWGPKPNRNRDSGLFLEPPYSSQRRHEHLCFELFFTVMN